MFAHNGTEMSSACFTLRPVGRPRARTCRHLPAAKREPRKRGDTGAKHLGSSVVNVSQTDSSVVRSATRCGPEDEKYHRSLNRRHLFGKERQQLLDDLFPFRMNNSLIYSELGTSAEKGAGTPTKSHVGPQSVAWEKKKNRALHRSSEIRISAPSSGVRLVGVTEKNEAPVGWYIYGKRNKGPEFERKMRNFGWSVSCQRWGFFSRT